LDDIHAILQALEKKRTEDISFDRIRSFAEHHGLTFLNQNYFKQIKTKMLLVT
jgi:hypothetical protein